MSATVLKFVLPYFFIILVILYASSIFIGRFVEGIFFFELLMMVLPYLLALNSLILTVFLFIILSRRYSFANLHVGIPFFVLLAITVAMGYWIYDFSFIKGEQTGKKEVLKVAFFNKLYENKNYTEIHKSIQTNNPDVIGLSEVTKEDIDHIAFKATYPYIYQKPYRDNYLLVMSKNPLSIEPIPNAPDAFAGRGTIRGEKYVFIVIHPLAIHNTTMLLGRNKQLHTLNKYVSTLHNANLVLMADMNTSPWSSSYVKFTSNLQGLKNAARGAGLAATWKLGPLITHIDHIFVSGNLNVLSYASIPVQGSDHNLQLATFSGSR